MGRHPSGLGEEGAPLSVSIRGPAAAAVRAYMRDHGHPNAPAALREILSIYFASTPVDGAVMAAREQVLANTKHWLFTRMSITFGELQAELDSMTAAIEKAGYGK